MSYRVQTDVFEGPFDLLLQLVSRQKVDVAAISVSQIADQYLAYVDQMADIDLDVASDFLYVASTLLELKAASLLPDERAEIDEEFAELSTEDTRDILVARLIAYKQYKNVAAMLSARMEATDRMHPRTVGLEARYLNLLPDYLENVTLSGLAVICADIAARRDSFLLEAEHITAMPISLELHARSISRLVTQKRHTTFAELLGESREPAVIVVTFLAVLELYKRGVVTVEQAETFGTLTVDYLGDPSKAADGSADAPMDSDGAPEAQEGAGN